MTLIGRPPIFPAVLRILKRVGLLGLPILAALTATAGAPERSVIQIFNFSQQPVWDAPWRRQRVRQEGGSGFVIKTTKGRRIMTNAHVVSWAQQILVRRFQDPRPFQAEVEFIGHDCDLALLRVADESFFEGIEPLGFGELPEVRSTVVTYGYPAGGEQISYTRGVVSRVEMQSYVHVGNRALLAVQTDAAINPGNSGGPVIQEDKVVGVSFQGVPGLENAGFFIPPEVITHFVKDVDDGTYHGFPLAGIRVVALQNPAYRKFLGVADRNEIGARIDSIADVPSTKELIRPDDVLLEAAGFPVASDGTILYRDNRVAVALAFHRAQHGEKVPLKLLRDRQELKVELPVFVYAADRSAGNQYDKPPRYFVHGGLVFTSLSQDYLRTFGRDLGDGSTTELVYELFYRRQENPESVRSEPVVLAGLLTHPVNANFNVRSRALVDKINGKRIDKLEDVVAAFGEAKEGQDLVEFVGKQGFECLDRAEAAAANPVILKTYGVPSDRRL